MAQCNDPLFGLDLSRRVKNIGESRSEGANVAAQLRNTENKLMEQYTAYGSARFLPFAIGEARR